jgi:hypothetical protein
MHVHVLVKLLQIIKKMHGISHIKKKCVRSLSSPACKAHAPKYTAICDMARCTTFFYVIS